MRIILIIFFCTFGLLGCSRQSHLKGGHVVTIESRSVAKILYYPGIIQPLNNQVISSPADGIILEMPIQYGERVKANQLICTLSSKKFMTDYKVALMAFLKAKSDFSNSRSQLDEAEFLHKNGLISEDDFKVRKTNYYGAQLAFLQAKDLLENLISQLNRQEGEVYKLSIADIDKITQQLHTQTNSENLDIFSPREGVLLAPNKNEDSSKKVTKGDLVKQGDVLAMIGDMSGVSVHIKVDELTVNQLKVGQKVQVTGVAFPEEILQGKINRVDRQGDLTNGELPTFGIEIIVPILSVQQRQQIHVGMSAKVAITIEAESQMLIPIKALSDKSGEFYAKIYDMKSQNVREVAVKTGKTTIDSVAILAGLKSGDKIVIPD